MAALSAFEAKAVNDSYRRNVEVRLAAEENDSISAGMLRRELEHIKTVDELLAAIGEVKYFSPWVLIEEADID